MVNLAKVNIWGHYAGAVLWDENRGAAAFEYDPDFIRNGWDLAPLQMPLSESGPKLFPSLSRDTFIGLPGLLADALPDAYGKVLLDKWLASQGRFFANPVERLCYQGRRSMGALEFEPAQDTYLETATSLEIATLVEVAAEVLSLKETRSTTDR